MINHNNIIQVELSKRLSQKIKYNDNYLSQPDWYSNTLKAQWKIILLTCREIVKYQNASLKYYPNKFLAVEESSQPYNNSMIPKYIYGAYKHYKCSENLKMIKINKYQSTATCIGGIEVLSSLWFKKGLDLDLENNKEKRIFFSASFLASSITKVT